jgi:hypothetical protein
MSPQTETTLRFTGGYPPFPVIVIALGLAIAMWFLYRRELKFVSSRFAKLPALLRSLAMSRSRRRSWSGPASCWP